MFLQLLEGKLSLMLEDVQSELPTAFSSPNRDFYGGERALVPAVNHVCEGLLLTR